MSFVRVAICIIGVHWIIWDFIRGGTRNFLLLNNVQTGSGAHAAFCSVGTVVFYLSVKRQVLEIYH